MSEETGVIERGQRGRSDTGHQETHSVNHTHCDGTSSEDTDTLSDLVDHDTSPPVLYSHGILHSFKKQICTDCVESLTLISVTAF